MNFTFSFLFLPALSSSPYLTLCNKYISHTLFFCILYHYPSLHFLSDQVASLLGNPLLEAFAIVPIDSFKFENTAPQNTTTSTFNSAAFAAAQVNAYSYPKVVFLAMTIPTTAPTPVPTVLPPTAAPVVVVEAVSGVSSAFAADNSLLTGVISGIVLFLLLCCGVGLYFLHRRRQSKLEKELAASREMRIENANREAEEDTVYNER